MKIITAQDGKKKIKMSKNNWENIGKKAGWHKEVQEFGDYGGHRSGYSSLDVVQAIRLRDDIKDSLENGHESSARDYLKMLNNILKSDEPSHDDSPTGSEMVASFDDDSIVPNSR